MKLGLDCDKKLVYICRTKNKYLYDMSVVEGIWKKVEDKKTLEKLLNNKI